MTDASSVADFLRTAIAAFVGTGGAVLMLRFLSGTVLGHWLAKGLVRYTAVIETQEHSKRLVLARLDADRSRFIDKFMSDATECQAMMLHPVDLSDLPTGAGPELGYLVQYGKITSAVSSMQRDVLANSHRFAKDESLPQLMLNWLGSVHQATDFYFDHLQSVVASDGFFEVSAAERRRLLMLDRQKSLVLPPGEFEAILERCRHYTQSAS